jgi:hypothetical protein
MLFGNLCDYEAGAGAGCPRDAGEASCPSIFEGQLVLRSGGLPSRPPSRSGGSVHVPVIFRNMYGCEATGLQPRVGRFRID